MAIFNTNKDFNDAKRRVRQTLAGNIFVIMDLDMTGAIKELPDIHRLSVWPEHRGIMKTASDRIPSFTILTARGEASTVSAVFGRHAAFPITIASNSGHRVLIDATKPHEERLKFPITPFPKPTWSDEELREIVSAIHSVLEEIGNVYIPRNGHPILNPGDIRDINVFHEQTNQRNSQVILDPRELCGAVIYQSIPLAMREKIAEAFGRATKSDALRKISPYINHVMKDVDLAGDKEDGRISGYIDIKPNGMSKGDTLLLLSYQDFMQKRIPQHPLVIVAGDSAPDLEMMHAAVTLYGAERVLNVWVGEDKAIHSSKAAGLDILQLRGDQYAAVPALYELLAEAVAAPITAPRAAQAQKPFVLPAQQPKLVMNG